MKIVLINTSESVGGAAIACKRLYEAHCSQGLEVKHLVLHGDKNSDAIQIKQGGWSSKVKLYLEKLQFWFYEKSADYRFKFSTATTGFDLSQHPAIQEADVIHFHWLQQGFLSLKNIQSIISLGKPVFWTMHDMWTFTGGCHYVEDCSNFKNKCGHCFMLRRSSTKDLSHVLWHRKEVLYNDSNLTFITCSAWLKRIAKTSKLLSNKTVVVVPNPIDVNFFLPRKSKKSKKYTLLIQAMDLNDERKGFKYFIECLKELLATNKEITNLIKINCFGKASDAGIRALGFEVHSFGFLKSKEEILQAYQSSDILMIPSLQDNLPNAVMESLSCGLPVVGFDTGGIPEMVDHKVNGFITEKKNVTGLAVGIEWIINSESRYEELSKNARQKVLDSYSYETISKKYLAVYYSKLQNKIGE